MKYERITDEKFVKAVETCDMACVYGETCIGCVYFKVDDCPELIQSKLKKSISRLAELEDEIEQGTLKEIPENAVVMTKEEFESLGLVVETVQEYESQNGQPVLVKERKVVKKLQTDFTELLNQEIRELQLAQTRKETAEKFAEKVKAQYPPRTDKRCTLDDCYMLDKIDEIAKEITGGEKEISNETV